MNFKEKVAYMIKNKEYGLIFSKVLYSPLRALQKAYRRINNFNFIYRFSPLTTKLYIPEGYHIESYSDLSTIPKEIIQELEKKLPTQRVRTYLTGLVKYGCTLWIAFWNEQPACIWLSRNAKHIPYWFIDLKEEDVVLMVGLTLKEFRGHGFSPILMQHVALELSNGSNAIYSDCKVYNKPSIRSMEKSGFELIGKKRSISEKWEMFNSNS